MACRPWFLREYSAPSRLIPSRVTRSQAAEPQAGTDRGTGTRLPSHLDAQGRYAEAEPLYQRSLAIDEKVLGPEHRGVAIDLNNLAALYDDTGKYAEAESLHKRSLAIREKALGPLHAASHLHHSRNRPPGGRFRASWAGDRCAS